MRTDSYVIRRCALSDVHAVESCTRRTFARHTHDSYGIGMIVRGAHKSWSGRGAVEAGRGNIITCNPGEVHDGAPIGDSRSWKMVYLAPHVVADIATDIGEGSSAEFEFTDPVVQRQPLARAWESAYAALTGPSADAESAQEQLMLLFSALLTRKRSTSCPATELERIKAWIDDESAAPITLARLAREAGLSRFQVVRGFTRLTGLTPHAYIVQRRLDAARALILRATTLAEAAAIAGFADQSHFNRTFVRRYGMAPGAYADAMRQ